jgi:hypothetical protein
LITGKAGKAKLPMIIANNLYHMYVAKRFKSPPRDLGVAFRLAISESLNASWFAAI